MSAAAHLAALLGLPKLGPNRLDALLDAFGSAPAAWESVRGGRLDEVPLSCAAATRPGLVEEWRTAAAAIEVDDIVTRHARAGVTLLDPEHPAWPDAFRADPEPPRLLFAVGDLELVGAVSVAIVGTRRCTAAGTATARELGHDLATAGVGVVSGLALGIDGAAHRGSLRGGGPTIGVVATGLDVVYPRRNADLWTQVADEGVLVSEAPLGTPAERWRFPARNRLIAAMSRVVIVVESGLRGGSMLTVESASTRAIDVMAVPGPVRSPASAGPNQLLADGCEVARDATDILVALGSAASGVGGPPADTGPRAEPGDHGGRGAPAPPGECGGDAASGPRSGDGRDATDPVRDAVSWPASSLDDIVTATGMSFGAVAARLSILELEGAVERVSDGYQRVAR